MGKNPLIKIKKFTKLYIKHQTDVTDSNYGFIRFDVPHVSYSDYSRDYIQECLDNNTWCISKDNRIHMDREGNIEITVTLEFAELTLEEGKTLRKMIYNKKTVELSISTHFILGKIIRSIIYAETYRHLAEYELPYELIKCRILLQDITSYVFYIRSIFSKYNPGRDGLPGYTNCTKQGIQSNKLAGHKIWVIVQDTFGYLQILPGALFSINEDDLPF